MVEYIDKTIIPLIDSGANKLALLDFLKSELDALESAMEPLTTQNLLEQSVNFSTRLYIRDYIDHLSV